jgi:hypothetical protein
MRSCSADFWCLRAASAMSWSGGVRADGTRATLLLRGDSLGSSVALYTSISSVNEVFTKISTGGSFEAESDIIPNFH